MNLRVFQFYVWCKENKMTKLVQGPLEGQNIDVVERMLSDFLYQSDFELGI